MYYNITTLISTRGTREVCLLDARVKPPRRKWTHEIVLSGVAASGVKELRETHGSKSAFLRAW